MIGPVREFMAARAAQLAGRIRGARVGSVASARGVVRSSAATIKHLQSPVHAVGRSGVKLTALTQTLSRNLIELQTEIVSAALTGTARRLEHAASAASLAELVRGQIELLPATRERLVGDAQRTARLFRDASREVRGVAVDTYREIVASGRAPAASPAPKRRAKPARKRAKRARKAG
jgi:hypothetical protein